MQRSTVFQEERAIVQTEFIRRVYNWMALGLAVTALTSLFTLNSGLIYSLLSPGVMLVLILAELGIVIALSAAIGRLQSSTALLMFFAYSFLNGLTLATIFLAYTKASIASTFFVTAGTFAAMSVYGLTTKRDLTSMGSFLMMGLIGIIIASFVNFFFSSPAIYWLITYAGVAIFVGLTAYDAQNIKEMAYGGFAGSEEERKGAVIGALRLYLDFINLFLLLLRIFGRRND
ncbi:MAG: Bax inhibitor-1/YccA family protein [Syntrophobacteraceae bacterium]|jgi:FtsH-binding integral membrane protein